MELFRQIFLVKDILWLQRPQIWGKIDDYTSLIDKIRSGIYGPGVFSVDDYVSIDDQVVPTKTLPCVLLKDKEFYKYN